MRRLIFVRHGQYEEATTGLLTPLGREQAKKTAHALRHLHVDVVWTSTLPRAKETAAIVAHRQRKGTRVRRSRLLCEVIPTALPPQFKLKQPLDNDQVRADKRRADRVFVTLFKPSRTERTEIVVCHGNLIRYLVCRALGIERRLWMRLDSTHCGLTEFRVTPEGTIRVVRYNDVGHMPATMRTQAYK
jgi:serine/threonine-protein phosphatase PGAM5